MRAGRLIQATLGVVVAVAVHLAPPAAAYAYDFERTLREGDTGGDVKALQVRVAGWFPGSVDQRHLSIDGSFGPRTTAAVKAFKEHYGLRPRGVARRGTFRVLNRLEDGDGSTAHFDWSEFQQKGSGCSAESSAYAGTFGGGMVAPRRVKRNVRRLMWRLEALRARGGDNPVGINSGFRSIAYNDCIGGARLSQHMYGTAADNRMANVTNRRERKLAKRSQLHGIACYASLSHNHFDLRLDNRALDSAQAWWWPERDSDGRDLDASGDACWGETSLRRLAATTDSSSSVPGSTSLVPSEAEVDAFSDAPEPDLTGAD